MGSSTVSTEDVFVSSTHESNLLFGISPGWRTIGLLALALQTLSESRLFGSALLMFLEGIVISPLKWIVTPMLKGRGIHPQHLQSGA